MKKFLFALIFFVSFIFVAPIKAQELDQLNLEYKNLLLSYDQAQVKFNLAKLQYEQLGSLTALEEAITATREVYVLRDEVLIRYFKILELKLTNTFGLFLDTKQIELANLAELISQLELHKQQAENILTQEELLLSGIDFQILADSSQDTSERVLPLLKLGKLQTASDKANLLSTQLKEKILEQNYLPAKKTQLDRWLNLISDRQKELEETLTLINGPLQTDEKGKEIKFNFQKELNNAYAQVSQISDYLKEIINNL